MHFCTVCTCTYSTLHTVHTVHTSMHVHAMLYSRPEPEPETETKKQKARNETTGIIDEIPIKKHEKLKADREKADICALRAARMYDKEQRPFIVNLSCQAKMQNQFCTTYVCTHPFYPATQCDAIFYLNHPIPIQSNPTRSI